MAVIPEIIDPVKLLDGLVLVYMRVKLIHILRSNRYFDKSIAKEYFLTISSIILFLDSSNLYQFFKNRNLGA